MDPEICDGSGIKFDETARYREKCGYIQDDKDYQRHLAEKNRREGGSQDDFRNLVNRGTPKRQQGVRSQLPAVFEVSVVGYV